MIRPFAPLLLTACVSRFVPPPAAPPVVQAGDPGPSALFLEGFDLVWDLRPHRLRRLTVAALGSMDDGDAQLRAQAQGGTWASGEKATDTPRMGVTYGNLQAPGLRFVPARATLSLRGRAKGPDGVDLVPEGAATVSVRLPDGAAPAAVAPWLTGLDVSTLPSHSAGYTLHALGVRLGAPEVADGRATLEVTAQVEAAPVLDRSQRLVDYQATVVVDLVLVVVEEGSATRVSASRALQRNAQPLATPRRGAPARVPLTLDLAADTRTAVAGLSGFQVEVDREGASAGRYLRALTVGLRDPRTDAVRDVWTADAEVRLSNAGELPRALAVRGEVEATVVELTGPAEVSRGRWRPEGGAGCATWPDLAETPCPHDPGAHP